MAALRQGGRMNFWRGGAWQGMAVFGRRAVLLLLLGAGPPGAGAAEGAGGLRLRDAAGRLVEPLAKRGQRATLLFFLTTECPIGNAYAPEIGRIVREYEGRGVTCYGVYAQESAEEIARHVRDYRLPLVGLLDPGLQLALRTGARVTPEACVLSPGGEVWYRGRIDDRAVKFGKVRVEPRVRDLREALEAVLGGRPVAQKITAAIGCYLDFPTKP